MFCLQCGSEMAVRARACPVCGHVYGERERSLMEPQAVRAAGLAQSQASFNPATSASSGASAPNSSPVKYVGEVSATGLPRDLPGRFVLGISLGMAADLLLPWVSVNNNNVTPANIGAPVIVVVALLAAAMLPVFTTSLRQHPVWSALPLIIGAFCAGIAGSVWLLLAPLTQIFAQSFGSDPSNLALSPQGGLYLFLLGSAILLVSGQRMLAAMHLTQLADARLDALRSFQARQSAPARSPIIAGAAAPPSVFPVPPVLAMHPQPPTQPTSPGTPMPVTAMAQSAPQTRDAGESPPTLATPAVPAASTGPVLPGSDAWNQAPAAPTPLRSSPGSGWGKPRGPQRLR